MPQCRVLYGAVLTLIVSLLLYSPFAQPVFPQKRRSPSPQKGPVPPPGKRPSQQQATASLPRSPRRIKPPTTPTVMRTADVDFVVAAVDGDTPEVSEELP